MTLTDEERAALRAYAEPWAQDDAAGGGLRGGNALIVRDADEVHAWPSSWSRGTWHTIRLARDAGKPCTVHEPWKAAEQAGERGR